MGTRVAVNVVLVVVALLGLLLAWSGDLLDAVVTVRVQDRQLQLALLNNLMWIRVVLAVGGCTAIALALRSLWTILLPPPEYGPFVDAITPVALELGGSVRAARGVIAFQSAVGRDRLQLRLDLHDGELGLWLDAPARRRLLVVPLSDPGAGGEHDRWHLLDQTQTWELRGDNPAPSSLLDDVPTVQVVTRLMDCPEVLALRHDENGVAVMAAQPTERRLPVVARAAVEAMRRLRMVNG